MRFLLVSRWATYDGHQRLLHLDPRGLARHTVRFQFQDMPSDALPEIQARSHPGQIGLVHRAEVRRDPLPRLAADSLALHELRPASRQDLTLTAPRAVI